MYQQKNSGTLTTLLLLLVLFVTTIISMPLLSETYILPKQLMLALALSLLIVALFNVEKFTWTSNEKVVALLSTLFLVSTSVTGFFSGVPTIRILWGETTRGNGLISYLLLIIVFFLTAKYFKLVKIEQFARATVFFLLSTTVYFFLQKIGLNIYSEKFIYGPMVGFFGNPNFTSSFMGMGFALISGLIVYQPKNRFPLLILAVGIVTVIYLSGSIQGLLLVFFSLAVYGHLYGLKRGLPASRILVSAIISALISFLTFIGFLGLGPLGGYLERQSLRIRLGYFESAILMFSSNPLIGVGTDSYGDYFRQFRPEWLVTLIGDGTTSNDAHNVYLNILATSGLVPFLLFTALNFYVVYRGISTVLIGSRDPILIISLVVLLCFQLQNLISINQIGLSIWGWFVMGIVVSKTKTQESSGRKVTNGRAANSVIIMTLCLGLTVGVTLLGSQRFYESLKLKSAVGSIIVDADQNYREAKFFEIAKLSDYWKKDVTNSLLIQEALLNLGASEAAETISEATYFHNQDSRDALWALTAIKTRREKIEEAIILREKLILKENMSSWVLLDQAEAFIVVSKKAKARLYLDLASSKKDVDPVRMADLEQKWLRLEE